jgi:6-phosphogluconolactonase
MADILVYVGTYSNDPEVGIRRLRLDLGSGRLEAAGATTPLDNPFFVVVDAPRRRLFATTGPDETHTGPDGGVIAFAIDPANGDLARINRQPSCGAMPCYLALAPSGRHVLVANYTSGSVAVLPVNADGCLGEATCVVQHHGSSLDPGRQEGPHVHSIVLDPSGRMAFAADLGTDQVVAYRFDAVAGSLAAADPPCARVQAGAGPRHLAFHPNGRSAYLVNELDNSAVVFAYDAARGALNVVQTISMLPDGYAGTSYGADLQILPTGEFLYACNREHNTIVVYAIDQASGHLRLVGHQACPAWPWNLAIAPGAQFLLAACQGADCVTVFRIDGATGKLAPTGQQVPVPKAVCVEFLR